ncbi:hypothetical protein MBLNU13_g01992t1 [Cladosporium sp. NU13]
MDDLTLQSELEALAGNAYNPNLAEDGTPPEPISTTIARWNNLFKISGDAAVDVIMKHRNNLTRTRVSDDHWEAVRTGKESQGYDREAYEYELELQKRKANMGNIVPVDDEAVGRVTYLVELSGPLESLEFMQKAAGPETTPPTVDGWSVEGRRNVQMCILGNKEKRAILQWAAEQGGGFEPTILVNPKSIQ